MGAEYPQLYLRYGIWCDVKTVPGWSAVNISSLANDALGEHRRHDTEGMVLEIDAPGERAKINHTNLLARRAGERKPRDTGGESRRR